MAHERAWEMLTRSKVIALLELGHTARFSTPLWRRSSPTAGVCQLLKPQSQDKVTPLSQPWAWLRCVSKGRAWFQEQTGHWGIEASVYNQLCHDEDRPDQEAGGQLQHLKIILGISMEETSSSESEFVECER